MDVYGNLEDRSFECDGPSTGEQFVLWTCELSDVGAEYYAEIYGDSATGIRLVDGSVTSYVPTETDALAADFLGFLASLPYEGSQPERAREWVEGNVDWEGECKLEERFGAAIYRVYGGNTPGARFLEVSSEQGLDAQS